MPGAQQEPRILFTPEPYGTIPPWGLGLAGFGLSLAGALDLPGELHDL